MLKWGGGYKHLVYKTGTNVKLINKAEYCQSVIADGKELITGNERGEIRAPELKDGNVFIIFKEGITDFTDAFSSCRTLTSIPENLFANCPEVTNFSNAFYGCWALKSIPKNLFDNNRKVTTFSSTSFSCGSLTGESPYTMVKGKKVHLYERKNYPEHFTVPTSFSSCFYGCAGLSDYAQIPSDWK